MGGGGGVGGHAPNPSNDPPAYNLVPMPSPAPLSHVYLTFESSFICSVQRTIMGKKIELGDKARVELKLGS